MFEALSDKLTGTLQRIRGQGRITDKNIEDAIKEIRLSLLEADVNFKVVKSFLDQVKAKALGQEVLTSLTAGQRRILEIARAVKAAGARMLRGGAFKPRTSPYSFQGLGEDGLRLLREAADRHGLLAVSEVMAMVRFDGIGVSCGSRPGLDRPHSTPGNESRRPHNWGFRGLRNALEIEFPERV